MTSRLCCCVFFFLSRWKHATEYATKIPDTAHSGSNRLLTVRWCLCLLHFISCIISVRLFVSQPCPYWQLKYNINNPPYCALSDYFFWSISGSGHGTNAGRHKAPFFMLPISFCRKAAQILATRAPLKSNRVCGEITEEHKKGMRSGMTPGTEAWG